MNGQSWDPIWGRIEAILKEDAVQTRAAKQHLPREELFAEWQRIGRALGWGPEEAAKLSQETQVRKLAAKYAHRLQPEAEPTPTDNPSPANETREQATAGEREEAAQPNESSRSKESGGRQRSDQGESEHSHARDSKERRERTKSERGKTWSPTNGSKTVHAATVHGTPRPTRRTPPRTRGTRGKSPPSFGRSRAASLCSSTRAGATSCGR